MLRKGLIAAAASGLFVSMAAGLSAHHSFASEFDGTKRMVLMGVITKIDVVTPHAWIYVDVKTPDGKTTSWAVEAGTPNALATAGLRRNSLPIGVMVTVEGFRAKDGSHTISGRSLRLPDGKDFRLAPANTGT